MVIGGEGVEINGEDDEARMLAEEIMLEEPDSTPAGLMRQNPESSSVEGAAVTLIFKNGQ